MYTVIKSLRNLIKCVLQNNEDKTFIKIHAPNDVLTKYAMKYDVAVKFKQITRIPDPPITMHCMETVLNDPDPDMDNDIVIRGW